MSPTAARKSRLTPLGPRPSWRCIEHASSCRSDAADAVAPIAQCPRSLGTCQAITAACRSLRTKAAAPPECASGPSLSVGADAWRNAAYPMRRAAPAASSRRCGARR
eukprot:3823362-Pyramimonas_sp.AAC.1